MNSKKYSFNKKDHCHTLDNQPLIGTSSVASVLAKPLTWWASGLAVQVFGVPDPKVLTKIKKKQATEQELTEMNDSIESMLTKISLMNASQYYELCDTAYRAHQTTLGEKADAGTDLHAEIEDYVKLCLKENSGVPVAYNVNEKIQPFVKWAIANIKRFLWSEGHCYSEKLWIGGICDIGYEDKKGKYAIMDIKSSKEAYLSQFWQCAGYAIQIEENGVFDAKGNQIMTIDKPISYFAVFPFGMTNPKPQMNYDVTGGKQAFEAEVLLYKKLNI